jgi:ABC-2 type transport system permease protein
MFESLQRILILCRKELLSVLKDPRSRIVLFAPIVLQTLLFGYAATFDLNRVPLAVLDQDGSRASHDLVAALVGGGIFEEAERLVSPTQIAAVIDQKRALVVLHIGPKFERDLLSGRSPTIQVLMDGRNSNTSATAASYISAVVANFNERRRLERGGAPPVIEVQSRAWYNENLETRWYMIPSLVAALSMLQTLMLTGLSVAREREQGTFDQLLVTPLRPHEIMIGKAVPPIMVGLVQSSLILLIAIFWFGIPFAGSYFALYASLLVFTIASVGIGLAISAYSANMQQAMLFSFVLLMPMMLLSGLASPVKNMPDVLQVITLANPLRHAIEAVHRVYLEGAGIATIFNNLWPLAVIGSVTLPTAAWLFRHRLV